MMMIAVMNEDSMNDYLYKLQTVNDKLDNIDTTSEATNAQHNQLITLRVQNLRVNDETD